MNLLEKIFGKKADKDVCAIGYKTMTEYDPVFTSYHGTMYQQELIRSCIERFSSACSKLKPELVGETAGSRVKNIISSAPNPTMTWPSFLARLATLYECDNTAFVVPSFARDMQTITGLYPINCEFAEVVEYQGEPWVRFHFQNGGITAIELRYVCIISKFQYSSEYFGEDNCLNQTMQLIHAQAQAQQNAIKNGAKIRFIAAVEGQMREEDMKDKRKRFMEDNFKNDNEGGLLLYDNTFRDLKQVEPQSYVINEQEMQRISQNVFNYFGINESILQNKYDEDTWGAWYEGKIEPFAIKLGEGLTNMLFSPVQRAHGNAITFSSNRLEYASNASKRNMIRDMLDRGIITLNEGREMLQMPPVDGGDIRVIRGEYVNASSVSSVVGDDSSEQEEKDTEEQDIEMPQNDTDGEEK